MIDAGTRSAGGCDLGADAPRRCVGVEWQQRHLVGPGQVGDVDAGVGTDPARVCLDYQHAVIGAHDATGLAEHELDQPRILLELGRQRKGAGTGLDRRQRLHPSLRLRNDLLRKADDVVVCDLDRG